MAAPGDSITFGEGPAFKQRTTATPDLVEAIQGKIKAQPNWRGSGDEIGGGVRSIQVAFGRKNFAVLFRGNGLFCGLVDIFELPREAAKFEKAVEVMKATFTANQSRRRHG